MLQPFILQDEKFQLFAGLAHLSIWLIVAPFLASKLVSLVRWMNEPLAPWQQKGMMVGEFFFASVCIVGAAFGAILLAVLAVSKVGLIASPWSAA